MVAVCAGINESGKRKVDLSVDQRMRDSNYEVRERYIEGYFLFLMMGHFSQARTLVK
jgi:hypothetical protein